MPVDIQLGHDIIDAGSDLIIGHHPHVVQPYESWNGKEIFYSLGNFYFGSERSGFTTKFVGEVVENMCDYGAYALLDLKSLKTDKGIIFYDKNSELKDIISEIKTKAKELNPKYTLVIKVDRPFVE